MKYFIRFFLLSLIIYSNSSHGDIFVPSKPQGFISVTSQPAMTYLSNRNLITKKTLLTETYDFLRKDWWYKIYLDIDKTKFKSNPVLSIIYENSKATNQTIYKEFFEGVGYFERIEEIIGNKNILLVKTYYQSIGATGQGEQIENLHIYVFNKEQIKKLEKIELFSRGHQYHYYLLNADGKSILLLESSLDRKLYVLDQKNFSIADGSSYSYKKSSPSFSCKKTEYIEKVICENPGLSVLDSILSDLYKPIKNQQGVKASQKEWLTKRNTKCTRSRYQLVGVKDCIADAYKDRIMVLSKYKVVN